MKGGIVMEKSRKIIDIVFKTISKLTDDEIEGIMNRKCKFVYMKDEKVVKKKLKEKMYWMYVVS
jgi:hypothetical protein